MVETYIAMSEYESFEHGSPKYAFTSSYIDFALEVLLERVAEGGVNVAVVVCNN